MLHLSVPVLWMILTGTMTLTATLFAATDGARLTLFMAMALYIAYYTVRIYRER